MNYKFDALRYCRNNQGRYHLPDGSDPMERIAEELHMMATALRAKDADYVALRNAVRRLISLENNPTPVTEYAVALIDARAEVDRLLGEENNV